ncbi:unnamed protein product, partial [Bubo scandiacus]
VVPRWCLGRMSARRTLRTPSLPGQTDRASSLQPGSGTPDLPTSAPRICAPAPAITLCLIGVEM